MYTVSFIIYTIVWLTLLCVLFDFYWIYIKNCGESVPSRPDRTEKIYKEPGEPYQIGKALRALFSPRKVYSRGLHKTTMRIQKGREHMTNAKQTNCAKYARGPPKWIRTDSLFEYKIEKVNQIWFTLTPRSNLSCVGRMLCIAHGRDITRKPAVWRVCGAVVWREPYNLTLESKTYYTQNYDNALCILLCKS